MCGCATHSCHDSNPRVPPLGSTCVHIFSQGFPWGLYGMIPCIFTVQIVTGFVPLSVVALLLLCFVWLESSLAGHQVFSAENGGDSFLMHWRTAQYCPLCTSPYAIAVAPCSKNHRSRKCYVDKQHRRVLLFFELKGGCTLTHPSITPHAHTCVRLLLWTNDIGILNHDRLQIWNQRDGG